MATATREIILEYRYHWAFRPTRRIHVLPVPVWLIYLPLITKSWQVWYPGLQANSSPVTAIHVRNICTSLYRVWYRSVLMTRHLARNFSEVHDRKAFPRLLGFSRECF
jgi:hypothetical protein